MSDSACRVGPYHISCGGEESPEEGLAHRSDIDLKMVWIESLGASLPAQNGKLPKSATEHAEAGLRNWLFRTCPRVA